MHTNETTNATTTATPTAPTAAALTVEQLAALPPEVAALMASMQAQLAETQAALLAAQTRKVRTPKAPVDPWSNSQLMVYGNDHSRVIAALSLLLRAGRKESEITQAELTKATLALQFVMKGWREKGRCAMAEASTRTAVGQSRLWRELADSVKLVENCKRIQLDPLEQKIFEFYCRFSFWPGEKEDTAKRFSQDAAALLMETWKKHTSENPDWYPPEYAGTVEEQPEPADDDDTEPGDTGDTAPDDTGEPGPESDTGDSDTGEDDTGEGEV